EQFVRQDAQSLRVILEFHHVIVVELPVQTAHQMRLRASSHAADLFDGQRHGARMLATRRRTSQVKHSKVNEGRSGTMALRRFSGAAAQAKPRVKTIRGS